MTLFDGRTDVFDSGAEQLGREVEASGVLGEESRFAVDADIVAVIFCGEAGNFYDGVLGFGECGGKFVIEIPGLVAGRIGVGDVGGNDLLARREVTKEASEIEACAREVHTMARARKWPLLSG